MHGDLWQHQEFLARRKIPETSSPLRMPGLSSHQPTPTPSPKSSCHFREHPPMQLSRTHSIPWWCVLHDSVGFQLLWGGGRGWSREHRFRNHLTGQMAPVCYCSSVCLFSFLSIAVIIRTYRVVLGSAVTSVSLACCRCSGTGEGAMVSEIISLSHLCTGTSSLPWMELCC